MLRYWPVGLADAFVGATNMTQSTHWVDEKDPAIEVGYDVLNQKLTFVLTNYK